MVRALRAVGAVLGAASGLDAEQGAQLNFLFGVHLDVHAPCPVDQLKKRQIVEGPDLFQAIVVADMRTRLRAGHGRIL